MGEGTTDVMSTLIASTLMSTAGPHLAWTGSPRRAAGTCCETHVPSLTAPLPEEAPRKSAVKTPSTRLANPVFLCRLGTFPGSLGGKNSNLCPCGGVRGFGRRVVWLVAEAG